MSNRLSIIIPAYNEKATIHTLLEQVIRVPLENIEKEILVIESNSTDGTRQVVQSFEKEGRIRVIYEAGPGGKGRAVKKGLAEVTGDWVLIQDADLEYDVADYPKLLSPLVRKETDFVLGSRHLGRMDWRYRRMGVGQWMGYLMDFGVWIYTQFFNVLYGTHLTDPCTMYKLIRRECLEELHLQSDGFDLDWEIVAKLVRRGLKPLEIPVSYHSRSFKEGKKIKLWRDGWSSLRAIIQFRFAPL